MTFMPRTRLVNPRLGTYFGIFASGFVAIVAMLAMFDQLGVASAWVRIGMLLLPIGLYAAIGVASYTREPLDYFAAGRRVPAAYGGLALAMTALGGTGIVALAGQLFLVGFDALCVALGALSGFVVMAVLLAPFIRKFGAYTIPGYLGRRFDSRGLRIVAAALLSLPMLLILAAELRIGTAAAVMLTGWPSTPTTLLMAFVVALTLAFGGVRSLAWSNVVEIIAAFLAIIVPVAIVGVMLTNFPLSQLSHGPTLRTLTRLEQLQGMPIIFAPQWAFDLPGQGLQAIAKRFGQPFGTVGPSAFVTATLTIMAGVAAAPWLLPRVATAPGVYEARKSIGWATFFFGMVLLTLSAVAAFVRFYVMDLTGQPAAVVPSWLKALHEYGFAAIGPGSLSVSNITLSRDDIIFALPVAAGLPRIVLDLAEIGVLALSLAAAGAATMTLGNILAEDLASSHLPAIDAHPRRITFARMALAAAALTGAVTALAIPYDTFHLLLWALAMTGSAAFPVLVLSIWWKRINAEGAIAGVAAGFVVAVIAIAAGAARWIGLDDGLAGAAGIPAATIAAVAVSLLTPPPSRHVLELVRDIRIPGGEILYDREMRLARLKQRQPQQARHG
jgi:cation/acetate symporter